MMNNFWRDKDGKIVIWQKPNLLLWMWIVCVAASKLLTAGKPSEFLDTVAFGSIFAWAYLEITQGASPFRRLLGTIVLSWAVISRIS